MFKSQKFKITLSVFLIVVLQGCASGVKIKERDKIFPVPDIEAQWIRDGEPIIFEGEEWYPTDNIENLLDKEVYNVGKYNDVMIFVEKTDVRPYNRIYTKFGRNKFRFFEKR